MAAAARAGRRPGRCARAAQAHDAGRRDRAHARELPGARAALGEAALARRPPSAARPRLVPHAARRRLRARDAGQGRRVRARAPPGRAAGAGARLRGLGPRDRRADPRGAGAAGVRVGAGVARARAVALRGRRRGHAHARGAAREPPRAARGRAPPAVRGGAARALAGREHRHAREPGVPRRPRRRRVLLRVQLRRRLPAVARPGREPAGHAAARVPDHPAAREPADRVQRARASRAGERGAVRPARRRRGRRARVLARVVRGRDARAGRARPFARADPMGALDGARKRARVNLRAFASRALHSPWGWIGLGTLVRLVHSLLLGNKYYFGDTVEYEAAALRFLHGIGLDASTPRAPLYPLMLTLSFWVGGEGQFLVARLFTLVLGVALMVVTSRLAARFGGRPAAIVAAAGVALSPTIAFVTGLLYPTTLYMLLLLAFTLVAWDITERPTLARGALLGALLALGWLTDQVFLAPALAIAGWLLWRRRQPLTPYVRALAMAAIVSLALALPYVRLLHNAGGDGAFMRKAQTVLYSARTDPVLSTNRWLRIPPETPFKAYSPSAFVRNECQLFVHAPLAYVHDWLWEFIHFFRPVADRLQSQNRYTQWLILLLGGAHFVALLTLAFLGFGFGLGPRSGRLLLALVVLSTAMFYSFFFTQTRYRIPIESHLVVLAALGVQRAFPRATAWLAGEGGARDPARMET